MEPDLLVTCPYNPAHRIRQYKLLTHMVKCKKSSNTENKVECPLNKSHVIDKEHLKDHIASCSSLGKLVDLDIGNIKQETDAESTLEPYGTTENWDEEPDAPSYDPMHVSSKRQVMRCVSGLSKSERKKFRDNERTRIALLKGVNTTKVDISLPKDTVNEIPLRPPQPSTDEYNAKMIENDHSKNANVHNHNKPHKFDHDSFCQKLYNKADSKSDDINQHSMYNTDVSLDKSLHIQAACSIDYYEHVNREKGDRTISDQEEEINVNIEEEETSETFGVNNSGKEKHERFINTSTSERVTDKLLALLKNNPDVKKVEPVEETRNNESMEKLGEKGFTWEEDFNKFNDRLAYLTDIQNAAAEESALLLKQLKELKLRRDIPRK